MNLRRSPTALAPTGNSTSKRKSHQKQKEVAHIKAIIMPVELHILFKMSLLTSFSHRTQTSLGVTGLLSLIVVRLLDLMLLFYLRVFYNLKKEEKNIQFKCNVNIYSCPSVEHFAPSWPSCWLAFVILSVLSAGLIVYRCNVRAVLLTAVTSVVRPD